MTACSRRRLLKNALIAGAFSALPTPLFAAERPNLFIPNLIELRRGKPLFLGMERTQTQLIAGKSTEVWGFNGNYLGPTIKIRRGEFAKLNYRNNLPQMVAMNIQGLQVSGELLGGVAKVFKPSESWAPIVPINQAAATCWYHACTLGTSAYQTYRGLAGMWIIEDDESRKSALPQKYGVDDIPLILQDMQLNSDGVQLFNQNQPHFSGDRLFVNGQEAPYVNVPRSWVRLRIVNASLSRSYDLRFDDQREFQLIALDQGFLPQAQTVTSAFLAPSERIEILVDLNEGGNATLISGQKRTFLNKVGRFFTADGELFDNTVLELRPDGLSSAFGGKSVLQFNPEILQIAKNQQINQREFHLDTDNAMINQRRFDPRRIDVTVAQGAVERWRLSASSAIGFKVQGAKFIVESRNGQALDAGEQAWKDSLWIDGQVTILIKFDNLSSNNYPFTFGSSDLALADKGCIGLIVVQ
ncbi:multicopper oxidase domain-containing protein [Caviibacterium pharyngocola]|uniref:Cell division protein FtsP n=1 Tax=Caviibacterium pharyngocola TaxID=28159 RepID=A0A2M8RY68_9PAST|nr:multicopper oxidase domain-containing protein [Caviibacterium pharyngocola]PJG83827.1 cell division protein FtsQ [Caviibacterium pharyngocola]